MNLKPVDFSAVTEFENKIAEFFGAPYAVAVDSCTHGLELCLRLKQNSYISCPKRTYISVPFLAQKLGIKLFWRAQDWSGFYHLTDKIIDAAVLWKRESYISGTYMCLSFQYQKHLSLGRGGMILCDDEASALKLKRMSYDGRLPNTPWREQNIDMVGYHYYMTPEIAQLGINKLPVAIKMIPRPWRSTDWPDLTEMDVFKKR